jgi:hypothetical protein
MVTMDETRLDLRAADQERMRQWEQAARESSQRVREAMRMGVGMYPTVGRRGTIYGTRRLPPVEVIEAPKDQDEEIKMSEAGRMQRPTYEEALEQAIAHVQVAQQYAGSTRADYLNKAEANALTSRAWSALAGLLRTDQVRADTAAYMERLSEMGLSPTGHKRDYIRTPSPEAQRLIAEAAQTELPKDGA